MLPLLADPGVFVDRLEELDTLERLWRLGGPGLVVVYGRRRVGKTRLVLEWLRNKPHAYFQAFAPRYGPEDLVRLYGLLGGVPFYLQLVDDSLPSVEAYLGLFGPNGVLGDEPLFLLREEFRDPHPYL